MAGLPELDVARVERWCRARAPDQVRDQVRVEVDVAERHLTIVECRPPWRADVGPEWWRFVRLRYTKANRVVVVVLTGSEFAVPRLRSGVRDGEC